MKKFVAVMCVITVAVMFASCGGGGGGSSAKKILATWIADNQEFGLENMTFVDAVNGYLTQHADYSVVDGGGNATLTITFAPDTPSNDTTVYVLISATHTDAVGIWANADELETLTILANGSFIVETEGETPITGTYTIPSAGVLIVNMDFQYLIAGGVMTMTGGPFDNNNFYYVVQGAELYLAFQDEMLDCCAYSISSNVLTITFMDNTLPLPRLTGTPGSSLVGSWGLSYGGDSIVLTFNANHTGSFDATFSGEDYAGEFYWVDNGATVELYMAMKFNKAD